MLNESEPRSPSARNSGLWAPRPFNEIEDPECAHYIKDYYFYEVQFQNMMAGFDSDCNCILPNFSVKTSNSS